MSEMNKPLISVCIVTYNHAQFIEKAILSALSQKGNFNLEICLGEDESSDGTREICERIANENSNSVRLFKRDRSQVIYKNGKPTGIFNFLETLMSCNGKYIALLEGDDYWTFDGKLAAQIEYLDSNQDCSGCFHSCEFVDSENHILDEKRTNSDEVPRRIELSNLLSGGSIAPTASLVFRKSFIQSLPIWYTNNPGDWKIEIILAQQGDLMKITNEKWSAYRYHDSGLWSNETVMRQIRFKEDQVSDLRTESTLKHYSKELDEYLANAYQLGFNELKTTHKFDALVLLKKFIQSSSMNRWIKAKHLIKSVFELC